MSGTKTDFPRHKIRVQGGDEFVSRYRKVARTNSELRAEFSSKGKADLHDLPGRELVWAATEGKPFKNLHLDNEVRVRGLLDMLSSGELRWNVLLLYRILRGMYGPPDVLSGTISSPIKPEIGDTLTTPGDDWGYVLKLDEGFYAEIRTAVASVEVVLRLWSALSPISLNDKIEERRVSTLESFLTNLVEIYKTNLNLFREDAELRRDNVRRVGVVNVFSERYHTASELLTLAKDLDNPSKKKKLLYNDCNFYLSSAMMFIVSLEAFTNILYHFLLKEEFREGTL